MNEKTIFENTLLELINIENKVLELNYGSHSPFLRINNLSDKSLKLKESIIILLSEYQKKYNFNKEYSPIIVKLLFKNKYYDDKFEYPICMLKSNEELITEIYKLSNKLLEGTQDNEIENVDLSNYYHFIYNIIYEIMCARSKAYETQTFSYYKAFR